MVDSIINFIRELLHNDYLTTIIISILPIIELRGAIPVAIKFGFKFYEAFFFAYIGSSFVIPFLLMLLKPILNWMKRFRWFKKFATAVEDLFKNKADNVLKKAEAKGHKVNGEIAQRYKLLGVLAFVAIPLPMTGVWTGSAIAVFLDLKFWPSLFVVLIGNLIAGIIMTLLSVFFKQYIDIIIGVLLLIVVIIACLYVIKLLIKMKNKRPTL